MLSIRHRVKRKKKSPFQNQWMSIRQSLLSRPTSPGWRLGDQSLEGLCLRHRIEASSVGRRFHHPRKTNITHLFLFSPRPFTDPFPGSFAQGGRSTHGLPSIRCSWSVQTTNEVSLRRMPFHFLWLRLFEVSRRKDHHCFSP